MKLGEISRDCTVNIETDTVLDLKQKVQKKIFIVFNIKYFHQELSEGKQVKLISKGRLMDDSIPLSVYELKENSYIHGVITQSPRNNAQQQAFDPRIYPFDVTGPMGKKSVAAVI